ncbi:MAG: hypothetical protein Q4D90_05000, partial [bacterium]|nr:hypothetical protein [bacterium]
KKQKTSKKIKKVLTNLDIRTIMKPTKEKEHFLKEKLLKKFFQRRVPSNKRKSKNRRYGPKATEANPQENLYRST